jgi:hypothetical protein
VRRSFMPETRAMYLSVYSQTPKSMRKASKVVYTAVLLLTTSVYVVYGPDTYIALIYV